MISIKREKAGDPYNLVIQASALHERLRALGVPEESGRFVDQPYNPNGSRLIGTDGLLTHAALLKTGTVTINLGTHFGRPPSRAQIDALRSVEHLNQLISDILAHYQPIDVSISVVFSGKSMPESKPADASEVPI